MSAAIDLAEQYARVVLTDEWETTQELARRAGVEWSPGGHELAPFRDALYRLELRGEADHEPRHNGHLWRRAQPCPTCGYRRPLTGVGCKDPFHLLSLTKGARA